MGNVGVGNSNMYPNRTGLSQSAALFQLSSPPIFLLPVPLLPSRSSPLPLSLPSPPARGLAKGRHTKNFWVGQIPPPHGLPFTFPHFPFSPLHRLEVDPSNTARGLGRTTPEPAPPAGSGVETQQCSL